MIFGAGWMNLTSLGLGPAIGGAGAEKKGRGAALPGAGVGQRRRVRRGAVFADMLPEPPCADS